MLVVINISLDVFMDNSSQILIIDIIDQINIVLSSWSLVRVGGKLLFYFVT